MVRCCDIIKMPSFDRNIAFTSEFCVPAAERQIVAVRCLDFKVVLINLAILCFATLTVEPRLTIPPWGNMLREKCFSGNNTIVATSCAAADKLLIYDSSNG